VVKQLRLGKYTRGFADGAGTVCARSQNPYKISSHPQVPRLLDYFEDRQQFYLVQEYISGLTLQEVKGFGPFSEAGRERVPAVAATNPRPSYSPGH